MPASVVRFALKIRLFEEGNRRGLPPTEMISGFFAPLRSLRLYILSFVLFVLLCLKVFSIGANF